MIPAGPGVPIAVGAALLGVGAYLFWVVPRLGSRTGALLSVALVAAGAFASLRGTAWLLIPVAALAFGHAVRWLRRARERAHAPSADRPQGGATALAEGSHAAPADPAAVGRYPIDRLIGRGAMSAVYLGLDPRSGRQVAIKTMTLALEFESGERAEARTRFLREAETAGRLQHPDIVTIIEAGEDQGMAFVAMEYIAGHDLSRHTTQSDLLPVPVVLHTLARVALALAHAHSQGVVHRDVKPANVMIDPASGMVKVTDFGIAHIADATRTRTGVMLGTPAFMSPEQMTGQRVDGRTDLYSLGVMLFQLLTGELPHRAESMGRLMHQIVNEPALDLRALRPALPDALARVAARALQKNPELRHADASEFAAELLAVAQQLEAAGGGVCGHRASEPADSPASAPPGGVSPTDPRHNAGH